MKFIERFSRKSARQPQPVDAGQAPLLMALEPRIMFDASVGVVAQDAAAQTTVDAAKDSTSSNETSPAQAATANSSGQNAQRHEVVFVDGQVDNAAKLLEGLPANAEVVVLDPDKDGLQQMADYLKGREGLDAIHLLSHGADGTVQLGNVWLAGNNLAEHRAALERIGSALKADGDLMLYGCDVGQGDKGQAFLDELASITGADVAASVDDTGAAALGGNWTLERSSGAIETSALSLTGYDRLMAVTLTGGQVASAPVLGSGGQLMRMVVGDFNNDGRDDILYQDNTGIWQFAAGQSNGSFVKTQADSAGSPFAGLTLGAHVTNGTNYHAADFDGDGDIDLLYAAASVQQLILFRNNGGSFTSEALSGGPPFGNRTIVADFNGDGAADLLYRTGNTVTDVWKVMLNTGNGTFTDMALTDNRSPFKNVSLPDLDLYNYRVADVDGDGDMDLIYLNANTSMSYYRNDNGTFAPGSLVNVAVLPQTRYVVADLDGDGDADILFQASSTTNDWKFYRNDGNNGSGDPVFTLLEKEDANSPIKGLSMANMTNQNYKVGDFDGDGDLDIFASVAGVAGSIYTQSGNLPTLVSATPADNSLNVSPTANIVLTFNRSVILGTGTIQIVRISDGVVQDIDLTSGAVSGSGTTWTINPPNDLAQGTAYAVRISPKAFIDLDGKAYKGIANNTTLNFTTSTVQPPVISNLNGDTDTYLEDGAYTLIDRNGDAVVSDVDNVNFDGGKLTVQISNNGNAGEDVLFLRDQGSGSNRISLSGTTILYNSLNIGSVSGGSNGNPLVISLTSAADAAAVSAIVHNLAYRNSNTIAPVAAIRTVTVVMEDGTGGTSATSSVTIDVRSVNDAPVVNITATNPTYTENTAAVQLFSGATINTVESGQSVLQMVFSVSGVANGASEKLVIDGTDVALSQGTAVTTSINGISVSVSVSSGTVTVTLEKVAGLSTATAQTVLNSIAYRNDSESPSPTNRVVTLSSVSDNGGSTDGGQPTAAVGIFSTVTVIGVNDAPVLTGGPYNFASINEDTTATGVRISTVLANHTMTDSDTAALRGAAIIAKTGSGTWQYSIDNSTWTDFGSVSSTSALLLTASTYIRYVPDGANGETATLSIRGWDQTTGTASVNGIRGLSDTTSNGGSTAFSTGIGTVNQVVTSVNDAPVMTPATPSLTGITDSSTSNPGNLVSSLLGGVTDVDTGAVKGMAITALTSTYGKWQYSTNGGSSWNDVGTVSVTSALILTAQNLVRFVPDGIHGETATITYKAWDQTNSTAGLQGSKLNTTSSGGTTAYSTGVDTATIVVAAVNDAPVVVVSGAANAWTEGNNVASLAVAVDSTLTVSDADGPNLKSATVTLTTYYAGQDVLAFVNDGLTMGNIVGSWDASSGTLTLSSAGNLATVAQFQAALRAVTYNNTSEAPDTTTRTVRFVVTDGDDAASNAVTRNITLTAVNDSPTISAPASIPLNEDVSTPITQVNFSDVDSTSGTVTFSVGSGTLSATSAAGVTVGGTSSTLTLSGTLADINQFIVNNRLVYSPVVNASGDVTLTISVNTSSVSDASTTLTLQVIAVNDAPVVSVPPSITVTEDVSSAITGISFTDIDAGANTVTATFSVPSGTLSATSGTGVTVAGSGTGSLTLSGSLADINLFVSGGAVTFKTAQDATASVTLTVSISDGGFSGTGGEQTDTKTVTLNVTAVNDAPVNNVPGAQTASQNIALGFNTANGNAISISDVDAGSGLITVTLTATNGVLSLGSLIGINMVTGTGLNNVTMTFEGSRANINTALQTLSFRPTNNYLGAASVTIETNDNGNIGTGGAKSDVDTISINVIPVNPKVTHVSAQGLDRTVKVGDEVLISMTWDQVVNVNLTGGIPSLLLETGSVDRTAVYLSGSGSNTLVFKYTVQAGDISADLDFQSTAALQMNGAVISNTTSDLAVLTLPTVGGADSLGGRSNIVVDGVVPVVSSVLAPANGTYITGQSLDFTVNFSEAVIVDTGIGLPRLAVTLDTGGTVYADYVSGSGSSALVFRMVVISNQLDTNGITLGSTIDTHGGAITDLAGNAAVTTLNGVASTAGVNIDGVAPTVLSVTPPLDGSYKAGDVLTFAVNASEAVQIGSLAPRLVLDVGGTTRYATYLSGSGSDKLVFQYVVLNGDNDGDGIVLSALDIRGERLTDLAGNDIDLTLGNGNLPGVRVDTVAPTAVGIATVGAPLSNSTALSYTVTFDEEVAGVDVTDFSLTTTGSASGTITGVTRIDARTYTVAVTQVSGDGTVGLNIQSGAHIIDLAGNLLSAGLTGGVYTVDHTAPAAILVTPPANGHVYVAGEIIDISVKLSEVVYVNGLPSLAIVLQEGASGTPVTVNAQYLSGSGSDTLVFRLPVVESMLDRDGLQIGFSLSSAGGSVVDAAGNPFNDAPAAPLIQTGVLIDAVTPEVASVSVPAAGDYKAGDVLSFTVTASEAVQVDTSTGLPRLALTIGGVTRYAEYVSGNGSGALTFQYTVQSGDNGSGISVAGNLDLNGGTVKDAAGNAIKLPLNNLGSTVNVNVDTTVPTATALTQTDATPTNGTSVRYALSFSERVSGVDASDFDLIFSGTANGHIESITSQDGQTYIITLGGLTGAGQVRLDLKSGTDIGDASGNRVVAGRTGGSYSIDRVAPSVTAVAVPGNGVYVAGQHLDFTVQMSEAVLLDTGNGSPRIEVTLDNGQKAYATYLSGAGSSTLVFRLSVTAGQVDSDGISVASTIDLNGATLRDAVGNPGQTALNGLPPTDQILIDAVRPTVSSVGLPASGAYNAGDVLRFTVNASENVIVDTSSGLPRLALNIGGVTRYASYVSGSGTSALVFEYSVQAGNNASAGIGLPGNIDLNGSTVRDGAGNDLDLQLNVPASASGVVIDTQAPQASDIARVDITPTNASAVRYTVTFDESVSGVDLADFSLAFTGSASGRIASITRIDGRTYSVLVDNLAGAGNVRLDLNPVNTGIVDVAGNPISGGLQGSSYSIDRVVPAVSSVGVPASGTYVAGQVLDFTVNTSEAVLVDSGAGNPRLAVTLDNGRVAYAEYLSGSGSSALVFRLTVTSGMSGNSTFAVAPGIDTNGGTLRDARGNDVNTALNNVGDTRGILVDARAPRPSSIVVDGPVQPGDTTLSFTLTFDEAVGGVDAADFSVLGTSSASGAVQSVQRIDGQTYRIVVGNLRGQGSLALSLNAPGSGIRDGAGNLLAVSLTSQGQALQSQDVGDLEYRTNPPQSPDTPQSVLVQPQVPGIVIGASVSPLSPGSLFEVRTVGGDLQPLGTIFLGNASSAPSFIAQVFGSSDLGLGNGNGEGFLGFGGGTGALFGGSTFASIFGREVPGVSEMNVFRGGQWKQSDLNQGLRGVFGVPTFGQQLQQINEADQRHVRELAKALAKSAEIGQRA